MRDDAKFGGFLDGPFEVVELEDGEVKVEGEGDVGGSSSSWRRKSTRAFSGSGLTVRISARCRKPAATTSKIWPGSARRTRARWRAWSPDEGGVGGVGGLRECRCRRSSGGA